MKKVLFATTALVMTAGVAAAEVSLSGDGRMGVIYNGSDFNFTSRARVTFNLSGETDGGLSFGGSFRVDHEGGFGARASNGGAGSVYISGAFGKITMGDVDSAAESAIGDLAGVGLTGLRDKNEFAYIGSGEGPNDPGLLYSYAGDNFNVYLSATDGKRAQGSTTDDMVMSVGANYTFGNFTIAAGYEQNDYRLSTTDGKVLGIAAIGTFGDIKVTAAYADGSDIMVPGVAQQDIKQYGLSAETTFGATTVSAFWREVDFATTNVQDSTYYGIGASYDLGGGASIKGGVVKIDEGTGMGGGTAFNDTVADFGIAFTF